MTEQKMRVLVVDDHPIVREGLRALLQASGKIEVVAEAENAGQALALAVQHQPDVILLDLSMPGGNGILALEHLVAQVPTTKVLVLSMHDGAEYVRPAMRAGAAGYLVKGAGLADLVVALTAVHAGQAFLSPSAAAVLVRDAQRKPETAGVAQLTAREREVLQAVAQGLTSAAIGEKLRISHKTVEAHRANLMNKLEMHDVPALVRLAIRSGLVALE